MIVYRVYQGSKLPGIAERLLSQRIYEESGELQKEWSRIMQPARRQTKSLIVVAQEVRKAKNYPHDPEWFVHGAMLYEVNRSHIQVYVRPDSRRKGVATGMLSRLRDFENYDSRVISAEQGYPGSEHWFERNLIYVPDYQFTQEELLQVSGELHRAGRLENPAPYRSDAVREIIKRRKRAFLEKVRKARKEGRI